MNKTKQVKLAVLITGIIISLFLVMLFKTTGVTKSGKDKQPVITVTTQEKQVEKNKAVFQKKIDWLNQQDATLSLQLATTKTALEKVKKKSQLLQAQVYSLIDSRQLAVPDSLAVGRVCEVLQTKVVELVQSGNEKDSLYEATAFNLEQQLKNKDTVIAVQEEKYQSLNSSFEAGLLQQKLLTGQNTQYRKQLKRQKFKQKLVSAGIVILSAVIAYGFINN